jgi:hypothetical protein
LGHLGVTQFRTFYFFSHACVRRCLDFPPNSNQK